MIYQRFEQPLLRTATRLLGNKADAEDAVQQVFAALIGASARLTEVNDLSAYLFSSLRRAAQKTATRARRQPIADTELAADAAVTASGCAVESPRNERLERCLANLPLKQREIIAMKIDGELTFAQIGEVLGVSPNTAASRYRLALEKLRTALGAPKQ